MPSPLAGIARFPRARLGHASTPLDAAPNLGAALGIDLLIKRDDCTGLAFGGNKVRQLEFHFGEARARCADTVLVTGAVQSNLRGTSPIISLRSQGTDSQVLPRLRRMRLGLEWTAGITIMEFFITAQVCLNGHAITSSLPQSPELAKKLNFGNGG